MVFISQLHLAVSEQYAKAAIPKSRLQFSRLQQERGFDVRGRYLVEWLHAIEQQDRADLAGSD